MFSFQDLTDLILCTDMSKHADIIHTFKEVVEKGVDFKNKEHRKIVRICEESYIAREHN